jgi:urease accessory protein
MDMVMITGTGTGTGMAETALYDMLSWMSPAWPIGAFAHSGGLEWAVEAELVTSRVTVEAWISDLLDHGALWSDAVIFVHAYHAVSAGDGVRLLELAELGTALLGSHERRVEATAQGAAFRRIARSTAAVPALALLDGVDDADLAYPLVAACLMAGHDIACGAALTAFLHGAVANLVSAAQRLIPLGQTDGQLAIRALRQPLFDVVARAGALPDGDPFDVLGSACLSAEIACMAHETQYTRLFRT